MEKADTQLIEQKITQQVTIVAGATGTVTVTIPQQAKAYLKGYGYTFFATNVYQLSCGSLTFPSRSDQEGSPSIPVIYGNPYPVTTGDITLRITNNSAVSHTYDVVMYVLCNRIIPISSTGGELVLAVGGGGGVAGSMAIYDSTFTTAANVTANGLDVNPKSPGTLLAGTKSTTAGTAVALGVSTACSKVDIQVDSASDPVYIGNATAQTVVLQPTQAISIVIDNLAKIYIKRTGGSNVTVNYIGS